VIPNKGFGNTEIAGFCGISFADSNAYKDFMILGVGQK
jgi:hypothetical protein